MTQLTHWQEHIAALEIRFLFWQKRFLVLRRCKAIAAQALDLSKRLARSPRPWFDQWFECWNIESKEGNVRQDKQIFEMKLRWLKSFTMLYAFSLSGAKMWWIMSGTTHNFCHGLKGLQFCVLHLYLSKTGQVRYFNVCQCTCIFLSSHYVIQLCFHVFTIFHHAKIYISFLAFRNNHRMQSIRPRSWTAWAHNELVRTHLFSTEYFDTLVLLANAACKLLAAISVDLIRSRTVWL